MYFNKELGQLFCMGANQGRDSLGNSTKIVWIYGEELEGNGFAYCLGGK